MNTQPVLRQIKASAGSGKTYYLTNAFIEFLGAMNIEPHNPSCILQNEAGWGDILAATFTNAAAIEMKERIIKQLKTIALGLATHKSISKDQANAWVDIILRQYNILNVRTIDSLLQHLVRISAVNLEIAPDFEIFFNEKTKYRPLIEEFLERARDKNNIVYDLVFDACKGMVHHEKVIGFMAGERIFDHLAPILRLVLGGEADNLSSIQAIRERLVKIQQEGCALSEAVYDICSEEMLELNKNVEKALLKCINGEKAGFKSAYLNKDELSECLNKASKGKESTKACALYKELVCAANNILVEGEVLRKASITAPFLALAHEIMREAEHFHKEQKIIPNFMIPSLTAKALDGTNGVSNALIKLAGKLTHIFIDEFQDTSREHWNALRPLIMEALARGGSFTIVGDVKQSIYGWNGGTPELFEDIVGDPEITSLVDVPENNALPINWRSKKNIVEFNNKFFGQLGNLETAIIIMQAMLGQNIATAVLGESAVLLQNTFTGVEQGLPSVDDAETNNGYINIIREEAQKPQTRDELREERVLELLQSILTRRPYGDIAILVRDNKKAVALAAKLIEANIPVMTENSLVLDEHPLIQELIAFLTFLDTPEDDLAFWTVLTGQIIGRSEFPDIISLADMAVLRGKTTLRHVFSKKYPEIWADLFEPFFNQSGLTMPYDLTKEIYRRFSIAKRFATAEVFLLRFLEIIHLAETQGTKTITAFLDVWKQSGIEEKAPMPKIFDAVRIMTIHKAKGLEFPVVIIPSLSLSEKRDSTLQFCEINNFRIIAEGCPEMGENYLKKQTARLREDMHLCYVAFTRAVEELHVLHISTEWHNSRSKSVRTIDALFACAGLNFPLEIGTPNLALVPAKKHIVDEKLINAEYYPLWPQVWRPMDWLPQLKIFRNTSAGSSFDAARRGEFIHACLANLAHSVSNKPNIEYIIDNTLQSFPYALPLAQNTREGIAEILNWVIGLPEIRASMRNALVERPILSAEGQMRRMDLLVLDKENNNPKLIIDYKTGEPADKDILQIQEYIALLENTEDAAINLKGILIYVDLRLCRLIYKNSFSELFKGELLLQNAGGKSE